MSSHPYRLAHPGNVNAGNLRISPPAIADSWARMPVQVQLADWRAFGNGSRLASRAWMN